MSLGGSASGPAVGERAGALVVGISAGADLGWIAGTMTSSTGCSSAPGADRSASCTVRATGTRRLAGDHLGLTQAIGSGHPHLAFLDGDLGREVVDVHVDHPRQQRQIERLGAWTCSGSAAVATR